MRTALRAASCAAFLATILSVLACGGGGNPTGPSNSPAGATGVTLEGLVLGAGSATTGGASLSSLGALTVSVLENPAIAVLVGADGSFTLRGLPAGSFTLIFSRDGVELGRFIFSEVMPNQQITVTVQLTGTTLVMVEEKRNGIGHGDIEIEGRVEAVLVLNPSGDSRFQIRGYEVAARPGQTAIREGNRARSVTDVTVGRQVHVKGSWLPAETRGQPVLALEIMLQGPGNGGSEPPPSSGSSCKVGPNAQVEGLISSKQAGAIVVDQQGQGEFLCEVSGSTRIRKGNTNYTFDQLQVGWRVHVSGTGLGESRGRCRVQADEIKVQ
jgi:hypothetical protein